MRLGTIRSEVVLVAVVVVVPRPYLPPRSPTTSTNSVARSWRGTQPALRPPIRTVAAWVASSYKYGLYVFVTTTTSYTPFLLHV